MRNFLIFFLLFIVCLFPGCISIQTSGGQPISKFIPASLVPSSPTPTVQSLTPTPPTQPSISPTPSISKPIDPPVILMFEIKNSEIVIGQSAFLSWNVSGATSVEINPGIGPVTFVGTTNVTPGDRTVYTLVAHNSGSIASKSVTVTVNKNFRAKDCSLTEIDVLPYGLMYRMNSEPSFTGAISTYSITFVSKTNYDLQMDNRICVFSTAAEAESNFNDDKYNSRAYQPTFLAIGTQGYMLTYDSSDPAVPNQYIIYFIKHNIYAKFTTNMDPVQLQMFARIVESRIY
jgi:hypothetical protein